MTKPETIDSNRVHKVQEDILNRTQVRSVCDHCRLESLRSSKITATTIGSRLSFTAYRPVQ